MKRDIYFFLKLSSLACVLINPCDALSYSDLHVWRRDVTHPVVSDMHVVNPEYEMEGLGVPSSPTISIETSDMAYSRALTFDMIYRWLEGVPTTVPTDGALVNPESESAIPNIDANNVIRIYNIYSNRSVVTRLRRQVNFQQIGAGWMEMYYRRVNGFSIYGNTEPLMQEGYNEQFN